MTGPTIVLQWLLESQNFKLQRRAGPPMSLIACSLQLINMAGN